MLSSTIPLTKPYVGVEELEEIRKVLESGHLAQGPVVAEFEAQLSKYLGARYSLATSSCTTAMHLALMSLRIGPGDEVIVPDFTFPATGNVVFHVGAKPILADVSLETYNLDPVAMEDAISARTKAVIVAHLFGHAADMDPIVEIAKKRGLYVVEDAACSVGATYKDKMTGLLGDVACFSFHPRKILTTGEGGMLVTNDELIADRAAALKNHGIKIDEGRARFIYPGHNFRLSDMQAAIGLVQLKKLDAMINRRRELARNYTRLLGEEDIGIEPPTEAPWARHTYQSYVVRLTSLYGRSRDECMMNLRKGWQIETQIGTYCLHTQPAYTSELRIDAAKLVKSKQLYEETLTLPLYHMMSEEDQNRVVRSLKEVRA